VAVFKYKIQQSRKKNIRHSQSAADRRSHSYKS